VFFTETHLNNQISDDDIAIIGFDIPFRKDRNSHGDGIIMFLDYIITNITMIY
jgi:hypothetical protein